MGVKPGCQEVRVSPRTDTDERVTQIVTHFHLPSVIRPVRRRRLLVLRSQTVDGHVLTAVLYIIYLLWLVLCVCTCLSVVCIFVLIKNCSFFFFSFSLCLCVCVR